MSGEAERLPMMAPPESPPPAAPLRAHETAAPPAAPPAEERPAEEAKKVAESWTEGEAIWPHGRVGAAAPEVEEAQQDSIELEDGSDSEAALSAKAEALQLSREEIAAEVKRRRNFAIISHPDAGKTTLTEKLLLFGGAIHEAGEVKARANRRSATSDWMELEKARGISITSTAMTFAYKHMQINLLDTPGHQDFSEDTYRTLAAADNAVMLVDERLEQEFGLASHPVTWPVGSGDRFCGLYHRPTRQVLLYKKGLRGKAATKEAYDLGDPELEGLIEPDLLEQLREDVELLELREDVELLEVLGDELDPADVAAGRVAPMYFCSAFNQFGVDLFLEHFTAAAAAPGPAAARGGATAVVSGGGSGGGGDGGGSGASSGAQVEGTVAPDSTHFTGLVFKLQSNMDPKHRDKVAFVRVVSGKFQRGMKVRVARTGRTVALSRPQRMFAQDRSTVQEGFAGDVIGLSNPGAFAVGDTLFAYTGPEVRFPPIPSFSPELFAYLRCAPNQRKAFTKGVESLLGEGAVQVLYSSDEYITDPILAAVGQLQFEVVQFRLKDEYGVDTTLDPLPFQIARWVLNGWPAVEAAGRLFNTQAVRDAWGRPVLLFRNEFALQQVEAEGASKLGPLSPFALPPEN
ncbi:peptide chain release factor [Raphidocelis subcapitata]|uniref:Peptide chain release factor n=1 Tax=Raphidocelis subcapitata TaxID=307507 RepID=A0A2V0P389_9CHLO|nr:peptide chain release factor [Raphidocelis subcapitata]|eukprot:GBF94326.1 peptide chain release factor [Raphidocelis subcapitata]